MKENREMIYVIGEILLTVYLYLVSYFYTLSWPWSWTALFRLFIIGGLVHGICKKVQNIRISIYEESEEKDWRFGAGIFVSIEVILGIYYIAYYPGGLIIDTFNQWYQVDKGFLLDWHPAIHTLLFLKIPSMICNSLAFVNLVQMVWLGVAAGYLGMVMKCWGIKKRYIVAAIGLGFIHPASSITLSFCWKDTAFAIFALVLSGQVMEIVFSDGVWLRKWSHIVSFGFVSALAALMRHNAILLVGPLIFLLAIFYWRKIRYYCLTPMICTLVFITGIKGPLYHMLGVQNHPQVSAEMLGVPMTILANVLVNHPEALDPEAREFLYRIGDQELWENTYIEGSWNSAKWMGEDISNDVIEETGVKNVLLYTWHAVQREPYDAYRAVVKLFEVIWKPAGMNVEWGYTINVGTNVYGYETKGIGWMQQILDVFRVLSVKSIPLITWGWYIGFFVLLLLFAGVSKLKESWTKCIYWIPLLCYNFGTGLVLCGADFRFFSLNTVITFPLLLAILSDKKSGAYMKNVSYNI